LSDSGALSFAHTVTGADGQIPEIVFSGTNSLTGSASGTLNANTFNTGPGGMAIADTDVFVRFDGDASLPTGTGGNASYLWVARRSATATGNRSGYLLTGSVAGKTYDLATNQKFLFAANGGNELSSTFGSTGGLAVLQNSAIVNGLPRAMNFLVRDGTLTLGTTTGTGNGPVTIQAGVWANAADSGLNGAASVITDDATTTRTFTKRGIGTLAIGNMAYTVPVAGTDISSSITYNIGTGTAGVFDGAIRETASANVSAASQQTLALVKTTLNGGVIEFGAAPRAITTSTTPGAGQVDMRLGGGFAAYGAPRSIGLNGNAALTVNSGGFVNNAATLVFGSTTADNTLTLTNDIDMNANSRTFATVRGTGTAPEGELSGVLSNSATSVTFSGLLKPDGTPLAAGSILISNAANSYTSQTIIRSGTVLAGGNAPGGAGNGVFGNATSAILLGDTRTTLTAVKAIATGNIGGTLSSGTLSGVAWTTIDGVTPTAGDRVFLTAQTTTANNGIYTFDGADANGAMSFTRVTDTTGAGAVGTQVQVTNGATTAGRTYYVSGTNAYSLDTDQNVALLTNGAHTIGRDITVGGSTLGTATLGGNAAANSSFTGNITLNRAINLDQAASGLVDYTTGTWTTGNNAVTINNAAAATGTVQLSNTLSTTAAVTVKRGVFRVDGTLSGGGSNLVVESGARLQGIGTIGKNTVVNSGATIAPGNSIGQLTVSGDLTLAGTSDFEVNASTLTNDKIIGISGLTYGGVLKITNTAGTFAVGNSWDLFDFTTQSGSFTNTFGTVGDGTYLPTLTAGKAWQFNYGTGELSISGSLSGTTYNLTATSTAANIRVGAGTTITGKITNTGVTGSNDTLNFTTLEVTNNGSLTGSTMPLSGGPVAASGGIATGDGTYTPGTAGTITFTPSVATATNATVGGSATLGTTTGVTVNAYDFAQAKYTGATLDFGNVHVGASPSAQTVAMGNQTVTSASYQDLLDVSATTGNAKVTATGFTGLAASASGVTTNNLSFSVNTASAGSLASTASLTLTSNANSVAGLSNGTTGVVGSPGAITTAGQVYSGLMIWNGASGSWGTHASWNDSTDAGVHVAPGLDGAYTGVDTATFGNTSGSVTVSLNGDSPSLNAVTFNNTGSYTIAQGSGGTLKFAGTTPLATVVGTHSISAPVEFVSNTRFTTTGASDLLTVSGVISGAGSFEKLGLGTVIFTNANTYGGGTTVTAGTLLINNTTGSGLGTGAVTVKVGAILGGAGSYTGGMTIESGATVAPGNSPGVLNTGDFTMDAGAKYDWQWDGAATPQFDQVKLASGKTLTLADGWVLNLINLSGDVNNLADLNTRYYIFDTTGSTIVSSGVGTNVDITGYVSVNYGSTTWGNVKVWKDTDGLGGIDGIYLLNVPEPTSLSLLGLGAAGLLLRRRRKA
jgi:autotransporter-associated beta strand protein